MTDERRIPEDPRADAALWDLVAAIPVPAAGADFLPRLAARLEHEAHPGVFHTPARSRRGLRRVLVAIAAAAAVAAIVTLAVLPAMRGTPTATAADMLASMNSVTGGAHTVRLTIKQALVDPEGSPAPSSPPVASEQLIMSASGDVRYTASAKSDAYPDHPDATTYQYSTYDEARHEMMRLGTVVPDDGASVLVIERPSWGTDLFETWAYTNFQSLASSLRALLAEGDPNTPVTETTYLGRPAWHADVTERLPGSSAYPKGLAVTWSVTVDKATGLMMRSDYDMGSGADTPNSVTESFWVTRLEVDPRLPKGWQRLSQSSQERVGIYDNGTRFGSPQMVARRAWPTLLLLPQQVPAGYRLTDVASTDFEGMKKSPKTRSRLIYLSYHHPHKYHWVMTSVDASVQRVVARYRRGFSTFVVDIRPLGSRSVVPNPVLNGTDVTLTAGYLSGQHASISISPNLATGPALVTYSDRSMITIYGALTRQELIAVANSLKVYGDVDKPLPAGYGD